MRLLFNVIKSNVVSWDQAVLIAEKRNDIPAGKEESNIAREKYKAMEEEMDLKLKKVQKLCDEMMIKAQHDSETILKEAKKNAEEIRQQAELESKRLRQETEATAHQQGYKRGYVESLEKYAELIQDARAIQNEAETYKVNTVNSMEGEIIKLVTACVEKIVRQSMDEKDELLINIIKGAIESIAHREKLFIRIGKEDYERVDMARERIMAQFPKIKSIDITIDEELKKGDLEIESESGTVNPSISCQIQKLTEEFDKLFSNEELM